MTSVITPSQARRLLTETIKGSPRIKNPSEVIAHADFIAELVQETIDEIREAGIKFPVNDTEMECAAVLHDIGYCFAENGYDHPIVGGEFLRRRGYPRIAKIIETHTYAAERVFFHGYKGNHEPCEWMRMVPMFWNQVLIDYASLHAGQPGERITPVEKINRFRGKRDETFLKMIDYAESRLQKEVDEINALKKSNDSAITSYGFILIGDEFRHHKNG